MNKTFTIRTIVLSIIVFSLFILPVSASADTALQNTSAQSLVKLDIMKGDEKGNLNLQNNVKRCEFVTLVLRMMGYDKDNDLSGIKITFKDITSKHWAYNNIKLGLKYKLISGLPDNTVAPDKDVTYAEALTVLIRALGYESTLSGSWPDSVINKSTEIGLSKNILLSGNKPLTRGEVAVLVNNSLTIDFNK